MAEPADGDLARYVRRLADQLPVVVVDGSPEVVRAAHAASFGPAAALVAPDPRDRCANGKAWGVITGLRHVRTEAAVIADDDVRWASHELLRLPELLEDHHLVLPQNHFAPMVWHAAWDTGRTLLNRAFGHDWPGTLAVRLEALPQAPPYDGNVLFENCEMVRTVRANGGRILHADDLYVARRPPSLTHFLGQRPRQAYDELAQPARMAAALAIVPLLVVTRRRGAAALAVLAVAVAEAGRRRHGGARHFPWYASFCAPMWIGERALFVWWAVWRRVTGKGVVYGEERILVAANPQRRMRGGAKVVP